MLTRVGITAGLAYRRPDALSGGQRQRVSLARALVLEPEVLIADEPFTALDANHQAQLANLLGDLREERRLTLVLISHDLRLVTHLCDRVVVMREGRIVDEARVDELASPQRAPYTRELLSALEEVRP